MALLHPWYRHSPWSGNLYREAPDAWLWRFGWAKRDGMSAKSEIGKAVEAAIAGFLLGTITAADVYGYALHLFDDAMTGEITDERADIEPICKLALAAMQDPAVVGGHSLLTYQSVLRLEAGERFGLAHAIKMKTDYSFPDRTIDLKVTWRTPPQNAAKYAHVAQLGSYREVTGKPQTLLYVTPKKVLPIALTDEQLANGWRTMLATWRRIDALDAMFSSPEQVAALLPLNLDSFRWPPESHAEALRLWSGELNSSPGATP